MEGRKSEEEAGINVGMAERRRNRRRNCRKPLELLLDATAGVAVAVAIYARNHCWNHRRRKCGRKEPSVSCSARVEKKKDETSTVGFISLYMGFEIWIRICSLIVQATASPSARLHA